MLPEPSNDLLRIREESSAWAVAHERGLTAEEQDRFLEWKLADPRHGEWLAKHQQGLASLKKLSQWRPAHSVRPNPDLLATLPRRKSKLIQFRRVWPVGLAAAVMIGLFLMFGYNQATGPSGPMIVRKVLEDGSTIDLYDGADVEVNYSAERRDIRLVRGEATFKVAKNPERPFVVSASGVTVRAVGTAFNINMQAKSVAVMVTEGKVKVAGPAPASTSADAMPAPELPILGAGERTIVAIGQPMLTLPAIEPVPQAEMDRVLAWQPRRFEFTDTPLAQVAAEFNAENKLKLVIDDPSLASMPMGATLRSDNVEGFVRILESNFGLKAERRGDMIMIRRGP
jgi:transmembrane sensor